MPRRRIPVQGVLGKQKREQEGHVERPVGGKRRSGGWAQGQGKGEQSGTTSALSRAEGEVKGEGRGEGGEQASRG